MDPIWLCVTTLLLHLLINRLAGRLHGWARVCHWPAMQLAAMTGHALFGWFPLAWLLRLLAVLSGTSASSWDVMVSIVSAITAAGFVRVAAARQIKAA